MSACLFIRQVGNGEWVWEWECFRAGCRGGRDVLVLIAGRSDGVVLLQRG